MHVVSIETILAAALKSHRSFSTLRRAVTSDLAVADPFYLDIMRYAQDHVDKYGDVPKPGDVDLWIETQPERKREFLRDKWRTLHRQDLSKFTEDNLADTAATVLKEAAARTAVRRLAAMADREELTSSAALTLAEDLKNIRPVHLDGLLNLADVDRHLIPPRDADVRVASGIEKLDAVLGGGFERELVFLMAATGVGKCLGRDTPVMKYSGEVVPVQDVEEGDLLMGPDSTPRRVLSTTRGHAPLFRVDPTKGDSWVCNDVHVLTLVDTQTGEMQDVPLNEYQDWNRSRKRRAKLVRARVDSFGDFGPVPMFDPYLIGLWLGDGSVGSPRICNPEPEVHAYLKNVAPTYGLRARVVRQVEGRCPVIHLGRCKGIWGRAPSSFHEEIRRCFVDEEKRVPVEYLRSSRTARLQLLAGLVDTDGHLHNKTYEIVTAYAGLRDDILFLARSLGLAAYAREKEVTLPGWDAPRTYHRIRISGHTDQIPCKVPRKKAAPRRQKKNVLRTGFAVEPIGEGEYFGFELDGDGRFLLGDFTVTHNTTFLVNRLTAAALRGAHCLHITLELASLKTLHRYYRRIAAAERGEFFEDPEAVRGRVQHWLRFAKGSVHVLYLPAYTATAQDIRATAELFRDMNDGNMDLLALDYLDLLAAPDGTRGLRRDQQLGILSHEIRTICTTMGAEVITASQANREGLDASKLTLKHMAGAIAKAEAADVVMGLVQDEDDAAVNQARLGLLKMRDYPGRGAEIPVHYDGDHMTILDLDHPTARARRAEMEETWERESREHHR